MELLVVVDMAANSPKLTMAEAEEAVVAQELDLAPAEEAAEAEEAVAVA